MLHQCVLLIKNPNNHKVLAMLSKLFLFVVLLHGVPLFGLESDVKDSVVRYLATAEASPATAEGQVDQISKMGDEALIYALPQLIKLNQFAVKSGSEFYTLILLTRASNMTTKISKELADGLVGLADLNDDRHNACVTRIRINLQ